MVDDANSNDEARGRRASDADQEISRRLRAYRALVGVTQASLAEAAGLTFQQIQKHETGKSGVSLPAGASDPEGAHWEALASNQRLARMLARLQTLPPAKLERVLDRLELNIEGRVRGVAEAPGSNDPACAMIWSCASGPSSTFSAFWRAG